MYDNARNLGVPEAPTSRSSSGLPVAPGDVIAGKLVVERVLGTGGCGVVVAARHRELGERVAVKLLQKSAMRSPETVERFAREARAAARLRTEHVARVNDFGTTESGIPYMVMECLDGEDLGATLQREKRVSIEQAVDYVLMACDAVAEAHTLGIIHRDLKPANLFLTKRADGRAIVKVLDFGISKLLTAEGAEPSPSMTRTQAVMGSPLYMSPEQMEASRDVDARADVWALGTILYQLIGGAPPFEAPTVPLLYVKVLSGERPTPLESVRPEVPLSIARAVERCLAREPGDRFPSVAHLAAALAPYASVDVALLAERIARSAGVDDGSPSSGVRRITTIPPAGNVAGAPSARPAAVASARRAGLLIGLAIAAVVGTGFGAVATGSSWREAPPVPVLRGATRVAAASALAQRAAMADLTLADATSMRDASRARDAAGAAVAEEAPAAPASSSPPRATARSAASSRRGPARPAAPALPDPTDVLDER
jgi:predicted Ser/Thr protein kinase